MLLCTTVGRKGSDGSSSFALCGAWAARGVGAAGRGAGPVGERDAEGGGVSSAEARRWGVVVIAVLVLVLVVVGVLVWRSLAESDGGRRAAAERFVTAWVRGERASMWRALAPRARAAYPQARFAASYRAAERAAGVRSIKQVAIGGEHDGRIAVAVAVRTADFGTLRGTVVLPVSGTGSSAGVDWDPSLRLPGLRRGEQVKQAGRAGAGAWGDPRGGRHASGRDRARRLDRRPGRSQADRLAAPLRQQARRAPVRAAAVRLPGDRARADGAWPFAADHDQPEADGAGGRRARSAARWRRGDPTPRRCGAGTGRARRVRAATARLHV